MKKKQSGSEMVIIDVRTNGEYFDTSSNNKHSNIGRLKGAIHIPLQQLQQDPETLKQLDIYKDKEVYLICSHSYRSRAASNILLKNGFSHVNNVTGGMTEWFRRYDELAPYKAGNYETTIAYTNISSAQVARDLIDKKDVLLIGIASNPRFFYDSATVKLYEYFPTFKNAIYFHVKDSLQVFNLVQRQKGKQVVLFNTVNYGAAELAESLTKKGIPASYLVGGAYYFYEYVRNNGLEAKTEKLFDRKNAIDFITPTNYCKTKHGNQSVQLVDLRPDTLFNTITDGIKYKFKNAAGSVNFPADRGTDAFATAFPDKNQEYVLVSGNGIAALELAAALSKKGYKISWLIGGLQRLEWSTINDEKFGCKTLLSAN